MKTPVFTGVCPALVTPFDRSGAIDYKSFSDQIDRQIRAGADAVCVCGTTGEAATMSTQEHIATVEFCVRHVAGRVRVIAGTGSNNTSTALYLTQHAQDAGADAALLVTPYYNKTSQAGLLRHYAYISQRTDLPIILYNVPGRTGVSFTAETYRELAQDPKINGVKEASGDFALISHTRALCGDDFYIWSGSDDLVVPMMALGAKGVISVAANLVPETMIRLSHLCLEEDFSAAASLQIGCTELLDALFMEVNPIPIKAAMELLGLRVGEPRLPLCPMAPEHLVKIRAAMVRCGVLAA